MRVKKVCVPRVIARFEIGLGADERPAESDERSAKEFWFDAADSTQVAHATNDCVRVGCVHCSAVAMNVINASREYTSGAQNSEVKLDGA
ncbi:MULTISPECIES: hypothetical protein [Lysobacter]|uniref:hypothetical protein n=1 Tax=Lysobacter TaxID=68 RepID=UPI001F449F1C|nr:MULTISPECIES: hypothetical protein [Lysobacter]UJB17724.1 hypothetical protein L1A79_15265 [Lysobacter capsici]UJQ28554.1 hypothetical protein L2D09_24625 [Lysobacter gummosus]